MTEQSTLFVVLAAGEGTRMRSARPKVMHVLAGDPLLGHLMATLDETGLGHAAAMVVGPGMEGVGEFVERRMPEAEIFAQNERHGTAHAVLAARAALERHSGEVIVLYGDTPLIRADTIERLRAALAEGHDMAVLGFLAHDPTGYGRLIIEGDKLTAIREERDADPAESAIRLCNSGVMAFRGGLLPDLLDDIDNDNAKGEYYLTDAVELAVGRGMSVGVVEADEEELLGVNTRADLAAAEAALQQRLRAAAMEAGATLVAPETVFLSRDTRLGRDVLVEPNVFFGPGCMVGDGATIRAFSHIEGADIGIGATVGPFARLRPGVALGEKVRIGNFVEVKSSTIEDGAKVNHLAYIGDAWVGADANVGAGTITCNYDGMAKHHTDIGNGAFIGSNSALVAPVKVGDGAYVGTGTVVTRDVAPGALAVGRARQVEKPGWVANLKRKTHDQSG